MHISLVTLFPDFFDGPLTSGLMQRAVDAGIISFSFHNPRDKTTDPHHTVDDRPYGGGPGMVMLPTPLADTLDELGFSRKEPLPNTQKTGRLIYLSPKGRPLTQQLAQELAQEKKLTLLCGRYEGIDTRIEELYPVESISVGDFVLNGGEAGATCLIESVARLLPNFMGHEDSSTEESFSDNLLEYSQYTRPDNFEGLRVPEVLRSGNHSVIETYKRNERLSATLALRPDLLSKAHLTPEDRAHIRSIPYTKPSRNLFCGLVHYPVLDKDGNSLAVSLTNLDIHDIARCSCTYGLGKFFVITPLKDQQELLSSITQHWTTGSGGRSNPDRKTAFSKVDCVDSIDMSIQAVKDATGLEPLVIGTTAFVTPAGTKRKSDRALPEKTLDELREKLYSQPVLLLFGTGHGLAPQAKKTCEAFLPPIRWHGEYNHLSVRSACAIMIDRILGDWL